MPQISGGGRDRNGLRLRAERWVSVRHTKHLRFSTLLGGGQGRAPRDDFCLAWVVSGQSLDFQGLAQSLSGVSESGAPAVLEDVLRTKEGVFQPRVGGAGGAWLLFLP